MSKVGPGRRPKSTGFRKGVSGNPAGRPRKERPADSTSAFDVVIDKTLTIEQDGKSREVTIEEALWYKTEPPQVYRRAFGSNIRLLFHVRSRFHRTSPLLRAA